MGSRWAGYEQDLHMSETNVAEIPETHARMKEFQVKLSNTPTLTQTEIIVVTQQSHQTHSTLHCLSKNILVFIEPKILVTDEQKQKHLHN